MERHADADYQKRAEDAVYKSGRIPDFGYSGDTPLGETYAITISVHRDSSLLEESNWEVISEDMESRFPDDVTIERADHWAVGWVDHLMVRMLDDDGTVTEAGKAILEWEDSLEWHGVADESLYFIALDNLMHENALEEIKSTLRKHEGTDLPDPLPDDAADLVYDHMVQTENRGLRRLEEDPENHSLKEDDIMEVAWELFGEWSEEEEEIDPDQVSFSTDPKQTSMRFEGRVRRRNTTLRRLADYAKGDEVEFRHKDGLRERGNGIIVDISKDDIGKKMYLVKSEDLGKTWVYEDEIH